jgi:hypothetical protein
MHPEAKDLPFKGGKRHWAGAELQGRKVRKRKGNQLWQASPLGDGSPCRPLHLRRLTSQHVVGPAPSLVRHPPQTARPLAPPGTEFTQDPRTREVSALPTPPAPNAHRHLFDDAALE